MSGSNTTNTAAFTVAWICAIQTEYEASKAFLDEKFAPPAVPPTDPNEYTVGRIGAHNVVIAALPHGEYGLSSATGVIKHLLRSFTNVRVCLMVGIGGGAPGAKQDIRLGDVVVSYPGSGHTGVFQYDFDKALMSIRDGKSRQGSIQRKSLDPPPTVLLQGVDSLRLKYNSKGQQIEQSVENVLRKSNQQLNPKAYSRPEQGTDKLYKPNIIHPERATDCAACGNDASKLLARPGRAKGKGITVHHGLIASANQVLKSAAVRDQLIAEMGVLCFEMEASGLMDHFPCLIIRGICDYSDSHKSKNWQGYAAMVAAAYAKDLLNEISPSKIAAAAVVRV
ncbi:hypothetical protein TWF718_008149 [Orbilia javanica]|uniref:Nucleoside phosphorylase domain-containing protein n=1 Tax=Orbilia javanica TaxID=47235 RepID=A0AAN8RH32_9PEZI